MKIDVYDLEGMRTTVKSLNRFFEFPRGFADFARRNWEDNHKGWKSSWIPNAEQIVVKDGEASVLSSTSNYRDQYGVIVAIQEGVESTLKGVNGLAVANYLVTNDGRLMLPRRSNKVKHAPLVYNTFCGWMASRNIVGGADSENLDVALDPRLYDAFWQAEKELREESRLKEGDFKFNSIFPRSLVRGYKHSFNFIMEFTGIIDGDSSYVRKSFSKGEEEFAPGRYEHDKIAAVHTNDLLELLRNQPELQKEDPKTYEPKDKRGRDLILLDDTIGGLFNSFVLLTMKERPKDLIDHLGKGGIEINMLELKVGDNIL